MRRPSAHRSAVDNGDEPYGLFPQIAAVMLFVVLGVYFKNWLLNGYIGPLFVFFVLYLVPTGVRSLVRIGRDR
jgi:sorbitol-specific phosphotransferase system component IIC